ncbi:hypothetical protein BJ508DRAFT_370434 [Ascobolus immersus RN42]|uniref:Uncharacterized protein n=1 Tax=Ascobolus immersus RN42 TaxID=1160509 RepID=A0A3N4HWQ9_ASCIM|nr:hypothetical protein BJ508DRAFT_370434 [Ascobolus immersus RN42]
MALCISPPTSIHTAYSPTTYSAIPILSTACANFKTNNAASHIYSTFRTLFTSHSMDRTFGLILLHRHFDLADDEMLVEYNGTSVPWKKAGIFEAKLQEQAWIVGKDGNVTPYEFVYAPREVVQVDWEDRKVVGFVKAFADCLERLGLEGVLGLCAYPGDDFQGRVEVTKGRANISLHPKDAMNEAGTYSADAAWFFAPPIIMFKCICKTDDAGNHTQHCDVT